jgi:response regulator RpfG family c-di-GMP phosphodiesterase
LTIKILVVDRDGHVQDMLRETLVPLECQVITASSTALAVFLARKNFPSFIVLNLSAEDDEFDLPQDIAHDPDLAHIPVIVFVPPDAPAIKHRIVESATVKILRCPADAQALRSHLVPYLRELVDDREQETTE